MDEDDVRYDVFSMIYDMLFDNMQLRVKQNKLSSRVLSQSQLNIDKAVSGYFKRNHKEVLEQANKASEKLMQEIKNQNTRGNIDRANTKVRDEMQTPGGYGPTPGGQGGLPSGSGSSDEDEESDDQNAEQ